MGLIHPSVSDGITLNAEQRRGRALLLVIFSIVLAIYGYFTIHGALDRGFDAGGYRNIGRILLFALLFCVVWLGRRWAKRLTVALLFIVSLSVLPVLLRRFHPLVLSSFLVPAILGCVLAFSKSIESCVGFKSKRKKN